MKKFFLSSLLIFSFFTTSSFAQAANQAQKTTGAKTVLQQGIEIPFVNKTLANGMEIIVLPDASVPIITVELVARNGSFTESPELNGLSHLFEHMFFKPNQASILLECEKAIAQYGALNERGKQMCANPLRLKSQIGDLSYLNDAAELDIYNGTTHEEFVNYYYITTNAYLTSAMRLINDAVRYPTFNEQEFAQEKEIVIAELDRHESSPFYDLDQGLKDKLFYKYSTRKKPGGTRQTVSAATTDQMRLIQSRYYVPNNVALVVTGGVKAEDVFKAAEQIYGSWEKRKIDPFKEFPMVEHPPLLKSEGLIINKKTGGEDAQANLLQNVHIQIGWHGPSIGKDDAATYAADVFSYILTQDDSRFQRTMVDSGLVTRADISYYTQRNVGPITVSLVTTPDKAKAALKAVYAEIALFDKPDYFTDEELENAKTILESRDLFSREQLSDYTHTLAFWWSSTGIDYYRGYYKNLRATSRMDTSRYVKTYIQGKPHVGIALISSEAQAQAKITAEDLIGK